MAKSVACIVLFTTTLISAAILSFAHKYLTRPIFEIIVFLYISTFSITVSHIINIAKKTGEEATNIIDKSEKKEIRKKLTRF